METLKELTDKDWSVAHSIAKQLKGNKTKLNELKKVISYLHTYQHQQNAVSNFFLYLNALVINGSQIGHGNDTSSYYEQINNVCQQQLKIYNNDSKKILQVLGWAARLMTYYDKSPLNEVENERLTTTKTPDKPTSQTESSSKAQTTTLQKPEAINTQSTFQVGDIIPATVLSINGRSIRYDIKGVYQKIDEKNEKLAKTLKKGQQVKLKVTELQDEILIKRAIYVPNGGS